MMHGNGDDMSGLNPCCVLTLVSYQPTGSVELQELQLGGEDSTLQRRGCKVHQVVKSLQQATIVEWDSASTVYVYTMSSYLFFKALHEAGASMKRIMP